ncbi:MAG TPA: glutaredoxin family protein [Polyangiales bacterium]|nr:glutaredoxin family protein [Polyangiales bacterium]
MVDPMGICEKHQLPLDRNGDCEMCRLSEMPSKAPPARSAWWALFIPIALILGGIAWAFASIGSGPEVLPQRGVRDTPHQEGSAAPARRDRTDPEPEAIPTPPPPSPQEINVPTPPRPESGELREDPRGQDPETKLTPDWKLDLARKRVQITMYATQWCGVCREARAYLQANRIDFYEIDTDADSDANQRLGELNPRRTIPTFQIDELVYVGFRQETFEAKLNQAARKHL